MGFGWNTRNAEQVQYQNGQHYDFNKIAERYKQISPLRGKRGHLNIRPHGERNRSWERVVKVSDNEYYLTNEAYAYWDRDIDANKDRNKEHGRAITFKLDGDTEYVTIHTPRQYWGEEMSKPFLERKYRGSYAFVAPSTLYFYDYNLPTGMSINKWGTKPYVTLMDHNTLKWKSYSLANGDVTVSRKVGEKNFVPVIVHKEFIRRLDREKTKELRKQAESFLNYVVAIAPLIERKYVYGNVLGGYTKDLITWEDIISLKDDEVPELWFELAEKYKHKADVRKWNYQTRSYIDKVATKKEYSRVIYNDVYQLAKPFKEAEVELGVPFRNNKYQSW
jgi:hypothetical protein